MSGVKLPQIMSSTAWRKGDGNLALPAGIGWRPNDGVDRTGPALEKADGPNKAGLYDRSGQQLGSLPQTLVHPPNKSIKRVQLETNSIRSIASLAPHPSIVHLDVSNNQLGSLLYERPTNNVVLAADRHAYNTSKQPSHS